MILSLRQLLEKAIVNNQKKRLAIAAAEDVYVLRAIKELHKLGLITPIFIGNEKEITALSKLENINLSSETVIHADTPQESAAIAVELVKKGDADMLMKGMITTKALLIEVIHQEKGISSKSLLSHLALFESPYYHKVFGLTDAAMNIAPDEQERIKIIRNAVNALIKLGISSPKVALLAAIERVNPKMQATVDAARLVELHQKSKVADCFLEGPLALDLAVSSEAAAHKGITGNVCGDADLLVVPEITSGNVLYKSFTCLGGAKTAGVVIGADAPIILTSRADSEESKFYSIALALNLC
jgi:phosphate butyryltransferase